MQASSLHTLLDRLLNPVAQCLTPEAAKRLIELRAHRETQDYIDHLADKSTSGTLTAEEKDDYESYIAASTLIGILQAQARTIPATGTAA